jgi:hypothetical protein
MSLNKVVSIREKNDALVGHSESKIVAADTYFDASVYQYASNDSVSSGTPDRINNHTLQKAGSESKLEKRASDNYLEISKFKSPHDINSTEGITQHGFSDGYYDRISAEIALTPDIGLDVETATAADLVQMLTGAASLHYQSQYDQITLNLIKIMEKPESDFMNVRMADIINLGESLTQHLITSESPDETERTLTLLHSIFEKQHIFGYQLPSLDPLVLTLGDLLTTTNMRDNNQELALSLLGELLRPIFSKGIKDEPATRMIKLIDGTINALIRYYDPKLRSDHYDSEIAVTYIKTLSKLAFPLKQLEAHYLNNTKIISRSLEDAKLSDEKRVVLTSRMENVIDDLFILTPALQEAKRVIAAMLSGLAAETENLADKPRNAYFRYHTIDPSDPNWLKDAQGQDLWTELLRSHAYLATKSDLPNLLEPYEKFLPHIDKRFENSSASIVRSLGYIWETINPDSTIDLLEQIRDNKIEALMNRTLYRTRHIETLRETSQNFILKGKIKPIWTYINKQLNGNTVQLSIGTDLSNWLNSYPNKFTYNPTSGRFAVHGKMTEIELSDLKSFFNVEEDMNKLDGLFQASRQEPSHDKLAGRLLAGISLGEIFQKKHAASLSARNIEQALLEFNNITQFAFSAFGLLYDISEPNSRTDEVADPALLKKLGVSEGLILKYITLTFLNIWNIDQYKKEELSNPSSTIHQKRQHYTDAIQYAVEFLPFVMTDYSFLEFIKNPTKILNAYLGDLNSTPYIRKNPEWGNRAVKLIGHPFLYGKDDTVMKGYFRFITNELQRIAPSSKIGMEAVDIMLADLKQTPSHIQDSVFEEISELNIDWLDSYLLEHLNNKDTQISAVKILTLRGKASELVKYFDSHVQEESAESDLSVLVKSIRDELHQHHLESKSEHIEMKDQIDDLKDQLTTYQDFFKNALEFNNQLATLSTTIGTQDKELHEFMNLVSKEIAPEILTQLANINVNTIKPSGKTTHFSEVLKLEIGIPFGPSINISKLIKILDEVTKDKIPSVEVIGKRIKDELTKEYSMKDLIQGLKKIVTADPALPELSAAFGGA